MNKGRFEGGHDHTLERKVDNKQKVLQLLGHRRRSTTPVIGAGRRAEAQCLGRELQGRCSLRIRPGHQSSTRDAGHILTSFTSIGDPRRRIDEIQLAGLDERRHAGPTRAAFVTACEEAIFP